VKFDYVIIGGGSTRSDEDLIEVIRDNADTMYHAVGTCRMGSDEASVVDTELYVRGIENL